MEIADVKDGEQARQLRARHTAVWWSDHSPENCYPLTWAQR